MYRVFRDIVLETQALLCLLIQRSRKGDDRPSNFSDCSNYYSLSQQQPAPIKTLASLLVHNGHPIVSFVALLS